MKSRHKSKKTSPVVDLKQLRPADVLLTTQSSVTSRIIRTATHSPYSHIVLHVGNGLAIESTPDDGVAFRLFELKKAEPAENGTYKLLATIPNAEIIHVYRHKDLANRMDVAEQLALMERIITSLQNRWGKDYSKLNDLGSATRILWFAPKLKHFILNAIGKLGPDKNKRVPGDFCSQLISNVYSDLGLAPFTEYNAKEIPPPHGFSDLKKNNMVRVEDAEALENATIPESMEILEKEKNLQKQQEIFVLRWTPWRRTQHLIKKEIDEIDMDNTNRMRRTQESLDRNKN